MTSWARVTIRGDRSRLLALALLIGVVGATVLTTIAGARRTDTSFDRFAAVTRFAEGFVNAEELVLDGRLGRDEVLATLDRIGALPGVVGVAPYAVMGVWAQGADEGIAFVGVDERFGAVVSRPVVLDGRNADPDRPDEVTVNEVVARELHLSPGDHVTLATFGSDFDEPGPELDATVTGVVRGPFDFINEGGGFVYPTASFYRTHRGRVFTLVGFAAVDLAADADLDAFDAGVRGLFDDPPGLAVDAGTGGGGPGEDAIRVQVIALLVSGGLLGLGGAIVVAQWASRAVRRAGGDVGTLRSLGMTRRQRALALGLVLLPAGVAGLALSAVGALVASPLMPVGYARRLEPDRGVDADLTVLVGGCGVLLAVFLLATGTAAWRVAGVRDTDGASLQPWRRRAVGLPRLSPPAEIGLTAAVRARRGDGGVGARLAGAVGATGLVAALVVGASLDRFVGSPARYGWNWDAELDVNAEDDAARSAARLRDAAARIADEPAVDASALALYTDAIELDGVRVPAFGIEPISGTLGPTG